MLGPLGRPTLGPPRGCIAPRPPMPGGGGIGLPVVDDIGGAPGGEDTSSLGVARAAGGMAGLGGGGMRRAGTSSGAERAGAGRAAGGGAGAGGSGGRADWVPLERMAVRRGGAGAPSAAGAAAAG